MVFLEFPPFCDCAIIRAILTHFPPARREYPCPLQAAELVKNDPVNGLLLHRLFISR